MGVTYEHDGDAAARDRGTIDAYKKLDGRLAITFPGAVGSMSAVNEGETGLRLTFAGGQQLELMPREVMPIRGGTVLQELKVESFCIHPGPFVHCAVADCEIRCCVRCGHHAEPSRHDVGGQPNVFRGPDS